MQEVPAYIDDMKRLRVIRGYSQVDLDNRVGVADGYTAKIETQVKRPSVSMLGYFAEALHADVRLIAREDDDMSQGGRKSGRFSKNKGSRVETEITNDLKSLGVDAERIVLSGAAGRFHSALEHDIRIEDLKAEVKARADGNGFIQLEAWMGTADLLMLRRDRRKPDVFMNWDTFVKLITAYTKRRDATCTSASLATSTETPSASTSGSLSNVTPLLPRSPARSPKSVSSAKPTKHQPTK